MKKQIFYDINRKIIKFLPIIIISLFTLTFIIAYSLRANLKNGTVYLKTLQGDSKALNDVIISGSVYDSLQRLDFKIEKGVVTKNFNMNNRIEYESRNKDKYYRSDLIIGKDRFYSSNGHTIADGAVNSSPKENKKRNLGNGYTESYSYNTNKLQPEIRIMKLPKNDRGSVNIIVPDCYLFSQESELNVMKSIIYDKNDNTYESNIQLIENNDYKYIESNIKNLTSIEENIYCIIKTDNLYRGKSSIYKVNEFYLEPKMEKYLTAKELDNKEQIKMIEESGIEEGNEKLIDIDLNDGNTRVHGMEAIGNKLAVFISNVNNLKTIEYQIWLFDPQKKEFISKQSVITSDSEYSMINVFTQEDYINFYFKDSYGKIDIITLKVDEEILVLNKISDNVYDTMKINNIYYKNGNTYIQITGYEQLNNDIYYEREKELILVFYGSDKKYIGQIITDKYMDNNISDEHEQFQYENHFLNEERIMSIIKFD